MLVIDEGGKSLGVMQREAAFTLTKEKGLDIIEIAPQAQPPVCRIMSFDKFRYQQEKKLKKQRAAQKNQEIKQVQVSGRTALNDLRIKARKTNEFMTGGHPINIILTLRGREKGNQAWGHEKLAEFLKLIHPHRVIAPPKFMGRGIQVQIVGLH